MRYWLLMLAVCFWSYNISAVEVKMPKIAATVNGEPIYETDLVAGLAGDGFAMTRKRERRIKLERLIQARIVAQFLRSHQMTVTATEIDAEVARLQREPPQLDGCPCCTYGSLEDFMAANGFDLPELRSVVANNLGFQKYMSAWWEKDYPAGEKRNRFMNQERERIKREYAKVSHIFFNVFQHLDFVAKPEQVRTNLRTKAQAAWQRLKHGEAFAAVAANVSEDKVSRAKGGALGMIPKDLFGRQFAQTLEQLPPGVFSGIVESSWGFHLICRENTGEEDILGALKEEFISRNLEIAREKAFQAAKVEIIPAR